MGLEVSHPLGMKTMVIRLEENVAHITYCSITPSYMGNCFAQGCLELLIVS